MSFFKEIPQILSEFSKAQKLWALILLLFTIVIITISPSLISAITMDRKDLEQKIDSKQTEIENLKGSIFELDSLVRTNQKNCTNEILKREEEFLEMLDELKDDALKTGRNNLVFENLEKGNPDKDSIILVRPSPQINTLPMVKKIEKFEKKIRAQNLSEPLPN
jgi:cell division protein FtsL